MMSAISALAPLPSTVLSANTLVTRENASPSVPTPLHSLLPPTKSAKVLSSFPRLLQALCRLFCAARLRQLLGVQPVLRVRRGLDVQATLLQSLRVLRHGLRRLLRYLLLSLPQPATTPAGAASTPAPTARAVRRVGSTTPLLTPVSRVPSTRPVSQIRPSELAASRSAETASTSATSSARTATWRRETGAARPAKSSTASSAVEAQRPSPILVRTFCRPGLTSSECRRAMPSTSPSLSPSCSSTVRSLHWKRPSIWERISTSRSRARTSPTPSTSRSK